jgi:serine/threonine protein kinase/tetratricopeptide (TPR) repeat protein
MACPPVATIVQFLEGRLPPAERASVEQHAAGCAACRTALHAPRLERTEPLSQPLVGGSTVGLHGGAAAQKPLFADGQILADRYRVVRFIAGGGMGAVYEVDDRELGARVALKVMHPEWGDQERPLELFRREILLARKVTHPNVCRIFDVGHHLLPDGSRAKFLTMELLAGETLAQRVRRGRMSTAEILPLVRQMADGLDAAHRANIVHRDFKSSNVMLVPEGDGVRAVVTDFGLAHSLPGGEAPVTSGGGGIVGSPSYMAPEQVKGGPVTAAADLYSLGVVLFELVTGLLPFVGDTPLTIATRRLVEPPPSPRSQVPDLDPRWEAAILRCLERDPRRRFANGRELVAALEAPRPPRRSWPIAVAGGLGLALAGSLGLLATRHSHPVSPPPAARRSVTVLGFRNTSAKPEDSWLSAAFTDMLRTELGTGAGVRVVSGESVARLKRDLKVSGTDSLAHDTLRRVHEYEDTDYVVTGAFLTFDDGAQGKLRLDLTVQDAASGETLAQVGESGMKGDVFDLVSRAGARLRQSLGTSALSADEAASVRAALPTNREAARLYADGLAKLEADEWLAARDLLMKAVAVEPDFAPAHGRLAEAYFDLNREQQARDEAKLAFDKSGGLPREQRLQIEAFYRRMSHDWQKEEELYRSLYTFFPDNPDYALALVRAQMEADHLKQARETVAELHRRGGALDRDPRLDLEEAEVVHSLADDEATVRAADRAIEKARARGSLSLLGNATQMRGRALLFKGERDLAKKAFEESLAIFTQLNLPGGMAYPHQYLGEVATLRGDYKEAQAQLEQAAQLFAQVGDRVNVGWTLNSIGNALFGAGEIDAAEKEFRAALAELRSEGVKHGVATALANLGLIVAGRGGPEAMGMFDEVLVIARERGGRYLEGGSLTVQADLLLTRGELAESRRRVEQALKIHEETHNKVDGATDQTLLAELARRGGDLAGAQRLYETAQKVADETHDHDLGVRCKKGVLQLQVDERHAAAAEKAARAWLGDVRGKQPVADEVVAAQTLASALVALGRGSEARGLIEEHEAAAQRTQLIALIDEQALLKARVQAALGHSAAAASDLRALVGRSTSAGRLGTSLQARLELARLDLAAHRAGARDELTRLAADARNRGFVAIARAAEPEGQSK